MTTFDPKLLRGPAHYRKDATAETSRDAARVATKTAPTQRARVLAVLIETGAAMTPEEITDRLGETGKPAMVMSIRPRCSELARLGLIKDSGQRGIAAGGCKAIRWQVVTASGSEVTA